jgi:hypothetical protein
MFRQLRYRLKLSLRFGASSLFLGFLFVSGALAAEPVIDLTNTTWVGVGLTPNISGELTFLPGNILQTTYSNNKDAPTTYRNGSWRQDEAKIYFQVNDRYAESNGIINGTSMSGTTVNIRKDEWRWSFDLKSDSIVRYLQNRPKIQPPPKVGVGNGNSEVRAKCIRLGLIPGSGDFDLCTRSK